MGVWEGLELSSLLASAAAWPDWDLREAEWNRRHCDRHVTAAGYAESMYGRRHIWREKYVVSLRTQQWYGWNAPGQRATHPSQSSSLHDARTLKTSCCLWSGSSAWMFFSPRAGALRFNLPARAWQRVGQIHVTRARGPIAVPSGVAQSDRREQRDERWSCSPQIRARCIPLVLSLSPVAALLLVPLLVEKNGGL